jgi:hypothetical protein
MNCPIPLLFLLDPISATFIVFPGNDAQQTVTFLKKLTLHTSNSKHNVFSCAKKELFTSVFNHRMIDIEGSRLVEKPLVDTCTHNPYAETDGEYQ